MAISATNKNLSIINRILTRFGLRLYKTKDIEVIRKELELLKHYEFKTKDNWYIDFHPSKFMMGFVNSHLNAMKKTVIMSEYFGEINQFDLTKFVQDFHKYSMEQFKSQGKRAAEDEALIEYFIKQGEEVIEVFKQIDKSRGF